MIEKLLNFLQRNQKEFHIKRRETRNSQCTTTYLQVTLQVVGKYFPKTSGFPVKFFPDTCKHWGFASRITECHLYKNPSGFSFANLAI